MKLPIVKQNYENGTKTNLKSNPHFGRGDYTEYNPKRIYSKATFNKNRLRNPGSYGINSIEYWETTESENQSMLRKFFHGRTFKYRAEDASHTYRGYVKPNSAFKKLVKLLLIGGISIGGCNTYNKHKAAEEKAALEKQQIEQLKIQREQNRIRAEKDSIAKIDLMKWEFVNQQSKIDIDNIGKDVDQQIKNKMGTSFEKEAAKDNQKIDEIIQITKGTPNEYPYQSSIDRIYDYTKSSSEIKSDVTRLIDLANNELSATMSHDKVITESGRAVSSTTGHSKGIGGGVAGLVPVIGGGKSSNSSTTTTTSNMNHDEYNKVRTEKVLTKIFISDDKEPIKSALRDSLSKKQGYPKIINDFINNEAKQGHSLARMRKGIEELSSTIKHPTSFKIPKEVLKKGGRKISLEFLSRAKI